MSHKPQLRTVDSRKVILVNGPSESGKDAFAATALRLGINLQHRKYASRLKLMTQQFFELPQEIFVALERSGNNTQKNMPLQELHGMSWREALIWMGEEVVKPKFGDEFFGEYLADGMFTTPVRGFVVSDSGFAKEARPVVRKFRPQNVHLVRVQRPSKDFTGDSRSYWHPAEAGILPENVHTINNSHELDIYQAQCARLIDKIFGIEDRDYNSLLKG